MINQIGENDNNIVSDVVPTELVVYAEFGLYSDVQCVLFVDV